MATLNTSTNGTSISKSYQSIVNAAPAVNSNAATYGQWAVYSYKAPAVGGDFYRLNECLEDAYEGSDGDLADLVDEFSDGRIQFAFVRVNDPNTTLPKFVLIACGNLTISQGYHVQITARSNPDLTPESILQKISDASGSKYTSSPGSNSSTSGPPAPLSSKPIFTPTQSSRGTSNFKSLVSSQLSSKANKDINVDEDGWGQDAPPVTRTSLEKVQSSYQPTRVDMRHLGSQKPEPSAFGGSTRNDDPPGDVVKGGYQPVGKVDIAALRREAKESGNIADDRPNVIKGSYEPIGKVDIAALRARAQEPSDSDIRNNMASGTTALSSRTKDGNDEQSPLPHRMAPLTSSERLTALPKPKVANRLAGGPSNFTGTKAPLPGGYGLESKPTSSALPIGVGRTFADQGGKTPAQVWAEKKARERGLSGASETQAPPGSGVPASPVADANQTSGGGEWKSSYAGKSWAPVQTTRTGQSTSSVGEHLTGEEERAREEPQPAPAGHVGAIRERFKDVPPMAAPNVGANPRAPSPPLLGTSNKPNASGHILMPGLPSRSFKAQSEEEEPRMPTPPPQPPRSPTPPTPPAMSSGSPIRVAMPVGRGQESAVEPDDARKEQFSPPPAMPTRALAQQIPHEDDLTDEPSGHDPARGAGEATAIASLSGTAAEASNTSQREGGRCALVQFDYEKAEDNEIELREGERILNIDMVDEDWWMGENSRGEAGLFPSNYVELITDNDYGDAPPPNHAPAESPDLLPPSNEHIGGDTTNQGHTATALYDYDAAEDNELSFPENAKIIEIDFPDDDWWSGEYAGKQGLFPANYVQLDQ
ncbi:MAG: hypothetical protein Q9219_006535 [cf. Caloplaca sp. 3 TL-2023]